MMNIYVKFAEGIGNLVLCKIQNFRIPLNHNLDSFIEKPGTCPVEKKRNDCLSVVNECNNDFECYGESKCCFDGCKKTCKERPDGL